MRENNEIWLNKTELNWENPIIYLYIGKAKKSIHQIVSGEKSWDAQMAGMDFQTAPGLDEKEEAVGNNSPITKGRVSVLKLPD